MLFLQFLRRLFSIFSAEANSAVSKLEDPVKMTEQGIRELKADLQKSLEGLAQIKAQSNRLKREEQDNLFRSKDYEKKATILLQKATDGSMDVADAERLAKEALSRKAQADRQVEVARRNRTKVDAAIVKMEANVNKLRSSVSHYENELKTLKSRQKVSEATGKLNKQLAEVDSDSTISMLERMREKVEEQEALADAYGDMADQTQASIDLELEEATSGSSFSEADVALEELKAKLAKERSGDSAEESAAK